MRCLFQPGHTPRISACLQLRHTGLKHAGRWWSASSAVSNGIRCRPKLYRAVFPVLDFLICASIYVLSHPVHSIGHRGQCEG